MIPVSGNSLHPGEQPKLPQFKQDQIRGHGEELAKFFSKISQFSPHIGRQIFILSQKVLSSIVASNIVHISNIHYIQYSTLQ
jgi:hypothetical protein